MAGEKFDDLLAIARSEFHDMRSRQNPPRVKNLQARFYIDKFVEHETAFDFIADSKKVYGEGPKTLIRALLFYRDDVIEKIEEAEAAGIRLSTELRLATLDFTPQKPRRTSRVKGIAVRMYIDQVREHREAYEFLQKQQTLHGDGNKTIIRALNHYHRKIIEPLEKLSQGK